MSWQIGDDPSSLVRPELRELSLYHLDQQPYRWKLDQNEVPWDLPRRLKERVVRQLVERSWATYPDFHGDELRTALGRRYDWPTEGVLVGNGSNELLGLILEALDTSRGGAAANGEILSLLPGFSLYRMLTLRAGRTPRFLGPASDLGLPLAELRAEIERDPHRPVILCSPNNPTGSAATVEQVDALLQRLRAPLLLDNAYGEFCRHDYRPLLDRHPHLILLRTFSKAWSLAGMRLGYLLADPGLVRELIKVKLPYNLSHAGVLAALAVLEEPRHAERAVDAILRRREQWADLLRGAGLRVYPSEANFLLVDCGPRAASLRQGLAERGILVRDVSTYHGLAGCLRFAIGSGGALRATRRALAQLAST